MTKRPMDQARGDPDREVPSVALHHEREIALAGDVSTTTDPRPTLLVLPRTEGEPASGERGATGGLPALEASLLDALRDAVVVADEQNRIVYANTASESLLGWPAPDLQDRPVLTIVPPRWRPAYLGAFERYVARRERCLPGRPLRVAMLRIDGTEVEVDAVWSEMRLGDGRRLFLASMRDAQGIDRERRRALAGELLDLLSQDLERKEAVARTLQALGDAMGWHAVALWTFADNDDVLRCEQLWHAPARPVRRFEAASMAATIRPGDGLPGRVVETAEPAWISDVAIDSHCPRASAAAADGLRAALAFPVLAGGRPVGVIESHSRALRHPDPDLLTTMAAIGGRLGPLLERSPAEEERRRPQEPERPAPSEDDRAGAEGAAEARTGRIEERLTVLAKAGWVLGASLDCRRTLQDLSEVGVGGLGELCLVGLVEDPGCLRFVAGSHLDAAKRALLKGLHDVPFAPGSTIAAAFRTGASCALGGMDDETLRAAFGGEAPLALLRQLELGPTLVAPLRVRGETVGILVFSAPVGGAPYGPGDVALAQELARRAAVAVDNARLFSETSEVAHTLQESLLPPRLPRIPGIEIAARYHPAGEHAKVGGDFYDAFSIGADRWGLLIGDVAGKGSGAAALTAVARHTARAVVRHGAALAVPAAVNEAFLEADEEGHFCTMIYAHLRCGAGETFVDLLNCGHPAPLVVRSDGRIDEVDGHGPLLGQLLVVEVDPVTVRLLPGDVLVLVTDGVLEARAPRPQGGRPAPRFFGSEGLTAVLRETKDQPAEVIARRIEERTIAFAGGRPGDDLAVLVVRVLDA